MGAFATVRRVLNRLGARVERPSSAPTWSPVRRHAPRAKRPIERCPPKAEVVSSNLAGSANLFSKLAQITFSSPPIGEALGKQRGESTRLDTRQPSGRASSAVGAGAAG